jgi:hypothetical protein
LTTNGPSGEGLTFKVDAVASEATATVAMNIATAAMLQVRFIIPSLLMTTSLLCDSPRFSSAKPVEGNSPA